MNKLGFAMCLIGCAGMSEAYGSTRQMILSAVLIGAGFYLMREKGNEKSNYNRPANRPYFLP